MGSPAARREEEQPLLRLIVGHRQMILMCSSHTWDINSHLSGERLVWELGWLVTLVEGKEKQCNELEFFTSPSTTLGSSVCS